MTKGRLEAFSDGVMAIIITIMVLELKVPHGVELADLLPLLPTFGSYILSFVYVGIYWNNHHHLFHIAQKVNGSVLWANSHLLFWLSLIPFTSAWMGENHFAAWPAVIYGLNLFMCGFAYTILARRLSALHGKDSLLAKALGKDVKGLISVAGYAMGISVAFYNSWISIGLYTLIALIWLIPDRRIENALEESPD